MKRLIQQVLVTDPHSPANNARQDILIINGNIAHIAPQITTGADEVLHIPNAIAAPGFTDPFAYCADPGHEYRETLETAAAAAAAGGYTDVLCLPNTQPVLHSKTQIEYVVGKSRHLSATIHPLGAITKNAEGNELAELYDMRASGAPAFSDGLNPIQSPGLLLKALQYVQAFDGILIQLPDYRSINPHGLMHEGIASMRLGMPARPALAEEMMVQRDIELVKYTGSQLHITGISTRRSVAMIQAAREQGINISCSVTPYHLWFCDEDLATYNTNLKVNPPLRTREDMLALRDAVRKGWVQCIATHHQPHNFDGKTCEFEYAKYGMTGLETTFSVINSLFPDLPNETIAQLMGSQARQLFGLPEARITEGAAARFTIFDRDAAWTPRTEDYRSKSCNSAFTGTALKGRIIATVCGNQLTKNADF